MTASAQSIIRAMRTAKRAGNLAELPRLFARVVDVCGTPPADACAIMLRACDIAGDMRCKAAVQALCGPQAAAAAEMQETRRQPADADADEGPSTELI